MDYQDDETIVDGTSLFRRIPINPPLTVVWDSNRTAWRASSASFDDHPNGSPMSVVLGDTLEELGRPPESVLRGHEGEFGLVAFTARFARQIRQGVAREPTPEEPAHGVVFGKKTKSIRQKLARSRLGSGA